LNQRSVDFLTALVGDDRNALWLAGSVPNKKDLQNTGYYSDARLVAMPDDQRHHVTAAIFPPGMVRLDHSRAISVPFIVFDDVGRMNAPGVPQITGVEVDEDWFKLLPPTTWQMETSVGNHQYGFHFDPALAPATARLIHAALRRKYPFLSGTGLHSLGQYFRLPSGTNTKPGKQGFRTSLKQMGPSYTAEAFVAGFGLDLDYVPAGGLSGGVGEILEPEAVKKLLEMIPNTDTTDYDTWIRVGHAIYGATDGSVEGLDLFMQWSARSAKFNTTQDTEKTWNTLSAARSSASTLRRIIEEVHGPDSKERHAAAQVFAASSVFTVIAEEETQEARATGMKLDELLREIARTQPVPPQHRNGDSPHWTVGGKVQTLRDSLKSGTVAPPVIVTPYERGILSVIAGMPGLGKSLLVLNQALAITYGRPDLIRYGAKLQFPGDVIYISNEDGKGLIKRRTQAWLQHHKLESAVPPHEIIPLKSTLLNYDGRSWQVKCLEILEAILEYVRGGRDVAMIVVDTMATSVTGINENAAQDVSPVMAFLDRLAKAFWASVTFVHHVNKASVGDEDRSIVAIKGSFSIGGAVRGAVTFVPANRDEVKKYGWDGRSVICEYVAKANDDRARYVACYYEQIVVGIPVGDAVDPARTVSQETPVLVPVAPSVPAMFADEADRDDKARRLDEALAVGHVWSVAVARVGMVPADPGVDVHALWGIEVKEARQIVDSWVAEGRYKIKREPMANKSYRDRIHPENGVVT
jgi:hypothetical protein